MVPPLGIEPRPLAYRASARPSSCRGLVDHEGVGPSARCLQGSAAPRCVTHCGAGGSRTLNSWMPSRRVPASTTAPWWSRRGSNPHLSVANAACSHYHYDPMSRAGRSRTRTSRTSSERSAISPLPGAPGGSRTHSSGFSGRCSTTRAAGAWMLPAGLAPAVLWPPLQLVSARWSQGSTWSGWVL